MKNDQEFELVDFTPEEGKSIQKEIQDVVDKFNGQFVVTPLINHNGTLGAKVEVFKKIELAKKKDILSPIVSPSDFLPDSKSE